MMLILFFKLSLLVFLQQASAISATLFKKTSNEYKSIYRDYAASVQNFVERAIRFSVVTQHPECDPEVAESNKKILIEAKEDIVSIIIMNLTRKTTASRNMCLQALARIPKYCEINPSVPVQEFMNFQRLYKTLVADVRVIDFHDCFINYVPVTALLFFPKLEVLHLVDQRLGDSKIGDIENLHILPFLKHLNLSRNSLTVFPMFSHFPLLDVVCLNDNNITELDVSRYQLENGNFLHSTVTHIVLEFNEITKFNPGFFRPFHYLQSLNLCSNNITDVSEITEEFFAANPYLKEIGLLSNPIDFTTARTDMSSVNQEKVFYSKN